MVLWFFKKKCLFHALVFEYQVLCISKKHYMKFIINHLFLGMKLCCIMF